jgi:hypothetical protein
MLKTFCLVSKALMYRCSELCVDPWSDSDRKTTTMFLLLLDGVHRSYFSIITDTSYLLTS